MKQSQVILITGASSGFGKITAQTLAAQGHIVYGTSRKQTENKGNVTMLVADVTDNSSIHCVVEHIMKERGRIDVLINNAGMGIGGALELATDKEIALQWIRIFWVWFVYVVPYYPSCAGNVKER